MRRLPRHFALKAKPEPSKRRRFETTLPFIEAFIPEGALSSKAEARLMKELTDILVSLEGIEPENQEARAKSVVFLYRPEVFVAGAPSRSAHYRFVPWLPVGPHDDEVRRLVVKAITEAVARAEGSTCEHVSPRVWVLPNEASGPMSGNCSGRVGPERILDSLLGEE